MNFMEEMSKKNFMESIWLNTGRECKQKGYLKYYRQFLKDTWVVGIKG